MIQFKKHPTRKKVRCFSVCKVSSTFSLKQHRRAKHQEPFESLVKTIGNFKMSKKDTFIGKV